MSQPSAEDDFQFLVDVRKNSIEQIKLIKKPKLLLIFSGKRKCGKDFMEKLLLDKYPDLILSFRISSPIKREYARRHGLDYEELLTASQYKETFRLQMVKWSENVRHCDAHHFLRLAILDSYKLLGGANRPVWILNDARRPTDLRYFEPDENEIDLTGCKKITIRIKSDDQTRRDRGWIFTKGIDDQTTECGLDSHSNWDFIIHNNGTKAELLSQLMPIIELIEQIQSKK